jgi:AraC-like DNA-binding protein
MQMRLQHISIHPILREFIEKIWIFESSGRVPNVEMKLIVPNGLIKLVIPFRNGLSGKMAGWYHLTKENQVTVIGICDLPFTVDAEHDSASGTIGVEFSPLGAYRFFNLRQNEIKNQIHPLVDILGNTGKEIQERISNAESLEMKIKYLQDFLLSMFRQTESDLIVEYCVRKIMHTKGGISIAALEKQTGYSSRWLNMKFLEKIGISPKNLCSITRFQFFYQALAQNTNRKFTQNDFHQLYYDQAHFIKEFKRFTGLPPSKFENQANDFGKIFYKD